MTTLNFKTYGQGEPIVILHGMFGMLDNWQLIAKRLSEQYMIFVVDLRNHGRSPHTDEFGYDAMVEDLHKFMEDNWLHHAHLIGHSMGGKVVMQFALEYPDMVDKLVVVDIAPKNYEGNHGEIIDALMAMPLAEIKNRAEAEAFLRTRIEGESTIQFLLKNLSREKEGGYRWKMNLPVIVKHYREILGNKESAEEFEGTTLFIKGEKSDYIDLSEFPSFKKNFVHAELAIVEDAGHWVHAEQPERFLAVLNNFLEK